MPHPMQLPARAGRGLAHVIVDTPLGSRNKYKFDADRGLFTLSRVLPEGMHFPYDFGSIPNTLGEDGVRRIRDLPKSKLDELEHFFVNYNRVHGRIFKPLGRLGPAAAERMLGHAIHRQDG